MHKFNKEILFDTFSCPKYEDFLYPNYEQSTLFSGFNPKDEGLLTIKNLIDIERTRYEYIRQLNELINFISCYKEIKCNDNGIPEITFSLNSQTDINYETIKYYNFTIKMSKANNKNIEYIDKTIKSKLNFIIPICDYLINEDALIDMYYNVPNHNNKLKIEVYPSILTIIPFIKSLQEVFKIDYYFQTDREHLFHKIDNEKIYIHKKRLYEYKFSSNDWMFKTLLDKGKYKDKDIDLLNGIYVEVDKVPEYVKKRINQI